MKQLTFNEWQAHLSKQLDLEWEKLKLIKNEKFRKISQRESAHLSRVQEVSKDAN